MALSIGGMGPRSPRTAPDMIQSLDGGKKATLSHVSLDGH